MPFLPLKDSRRGLRNDVENKEPLTKFFSYEIEKYIIYPKAETNLVSYEFNIGVYFVHIKFRI